ncbi:MAG: hypothetical protein OXQ92_04185, partial [Boseongicola sp.]|nr:hypothetical protein [Boseongicola sp.]
GTSPPPGNGFLPAGLLFLAFGSIALIPILVRAFMFSGSSGMAFDLAIVLACCALAVFFNHQSKKGPRNALQIDYAAREVRLGSETANGAFVRHKVCPFGQIESAKVAKLKSGDLELHLDLGSEIARIPFFNADVAELKDIVAKINAAKESDQMAPVRSRVRSTIMGMGASYREVSRRVVSRMHSRPA